MQSGLMVYKLALPAGFAIGWMVIRAIRSRLDDNTLERAPFYAVGGLLFLFVIAAALRFGLELEFVFPEFIRTKATFFKWTAMEAALALTFGAAAAAEAGKRARQAALETGNLRGNAGLSWLAGMTPREAASFLLIMTVVLGAEAWMLRPVFSRCKDIVNDNGITIQSLDSTCGPAALSTLLRTFGHEVTEMELARIGGTRTNGMTGGELCSVAEQLGFKPRFVVTDPESIAGNASPCLLGVGDDHWVTFLGYNHRIGKFVLADPSFGIDLTDRESLVKTWRGKALYLDPSPGPAAAGATGESAGRKTGVFMSGHPDPAKLPGVAKLLGL